MGRYVFAELVDSPDGGKEPRLPENDGYLLIAEPGDHPPWALYDVSLTDDGVTTAGSSQASDELRVLLDSACEYPPALALARKAMSAGANWHGDLPTHDEFSAHLMDVLRMHMRAQPTVRYRLVEAVEDEVGYLARGGFYWVLRVDPRSQSVWWVSGDYEIYRNPMSHFKLNEDDVRALSDRRCDPA